MNPAGRTYAITVTTTTVSGRKADGWRISVDCTEHSGGAYRMGRQPEASRIAEGMGETLAPLFELAQLAIEERQKLPIEDSGG